MFDRFTDRARKVMALAHQEAQRLNHDYIGTEHILLALAKEGSGVGASVLKNFGASPAKVRRAIELLVKPGPDAVTTHTPQTPRAKRVIEHAFAEARGLRHNYVGTEHLLLGMIREEESIAASVLAGLGIRLPDARDEVRRLLDTDAAAQDVRKRSGLTQSPPRTRCPKTHASLRRARPRTRSSRCCRSASTSASLGPATRPPPPLATASSSRANFAA